MKASMLVLRFMVLLCIWAALAMGCKPEEITDTPQPEPKDTVSAPPEWMPHPAFYGSDKVQWASLVKDGNLYAMGNRTFLYLKGNPLLGRSWKGFQVYDNEIRSFLPFITPDWSMSTVGDRQLVIYPTALANSANIFVDIKSLSPGDYSFANSYSSLRRTMGVFLYSTPDSFQVALFMNRNDTLGILYIKGGVIQSLAPRMREYAFFPLPDGAQVSYPKFMSLMGNEVLLSYNAYSIRPFGQALLTWSPEKGFSPYFPQLENPSAELIDAFPSEDQQFAWLIGGYPNYHVFKVYPGQMPIQQWSNISNVNVIRGRDIGPYLAFFFFDELYLLEKETGKVWQAPNLGLDGHFISDVALYRDTVVISSFTGGVFYQPLSTVWPK